MGTARLIESFWTCQKRYRLERWIEAHGHRWPRPGQARVGEPVCAAECIARVLSWLDSRNDPHGYLPPTGAAEEVELAAGWAGKTGRLWDGLVATSWVVDRGGRWQWHDYATVNGVTIRGRLKMRARRERDGEQNGERDGEQEGEQTREREGERGGERTREPHGRAGCPDVPMSRSPDVPRSSLDDDDDDDGRARVRLPEAGPSRPAAHPARPAQATAPGDDPEGRALGAMRAAYERAFVLRRWAAPGHAEEAEALVRLAMRRHGVEAIQGAFERWIQEHRNGSPPQIYRFARDPSRWIPAASGTEAASDPGLAERRLWLETLEEERGRGARENQEAEWRAAGIRY